MFVGILAAENSFQHIARVLRTDHRVNPARYRKRPRELPISIVAVTEAEWALPRQVAQQNVGLPKNCHRVKEIERFREWQVALSDVARQASMFSPLHVNHNL